MLALTVARSAGSKRAKLKHFFPEPLEQPTTAQTREQQIAALRAATRARNG